MSERTHDILVVLSFVATGVLLCFLVYGVYTGYHSEENKKYREVAAAAEKATTVDDSTTVLRYVDSLTQSKIREFTAHDGKLLCVATFDIHGNTISCVKIDQPQSCKASY